MRARAASARSVSSGVRSLGPSHSIWGHSSLNHAVRYIEASRISVATLSEPVLAGLVAFYAWDQAVTTQTAVGYVIICLSVVVLVLDRESKSEAAAGSAGTTQAEPQEDQPAQGQ